MVIASSEIEGAFDFTSKDKASALVCTFETSHKGLRFPCVGYSTSNGDILESVTLELDIHQLQAYYTLREFKGITLSLARKKIIALNITRSKVSIDVSKNNVIYTVLIKI